MHRIVADLGGVIDVRTTVGRGTTFTIWLPIAGEVAAPSAFREPPQRFDILLTDKTMSELVGTDLAREIRLQRPDIPRIAVALEDPAGRPRRAN